MSDESDTPVTITQWQLSARGMPRWRRVLSALLRAAMKLRIPRAGRGWARVTLNGMTSVPVERQISRAAAIAAAKEHFR